MTWTGRARWTDRCGVARDRLKTKYPQLETTGFRDSIRSAEPDLAQDLAELEMVVPDGYFWSDGVLHVFEIDVTHRTSFEKWEIYDELKDLFPVRAFSVDELGNELEICLDMVVAIWAYQKDPNLRLAELVHHSRRDSL